MISNSVPQYRENLCGRSAAWRLSKIICSVAGINLHFRSEKTNPPDRQNYRQAGCLESSSCQ
jgi:hypothetical protein